MKDRYSDIGRMRSVEFAAVCITLAGAMYYLDIFISDKMTKPQVKQVPSMPHIVTPPVQQGTPPTLKPLTKAEKSILCNAWSDCSLLSEVVVYEARGEPLEGRRMVAQVVLNRVEHQSWPNTIEEVVHQSKQFSYLEDKQRQKTPTKEDWTEAASVAYNVLHGVVEVDTKATFYHERKVNPFWADHKEMVAVVGNHVFYQGGR